MSIFQQNNETVCHWKECYNVAGEPNEDEPQDINIPQSEGTCAVEGLGVSSNQFLNLLKKKVDFGYLDNPMFDNIGGYWDDDTVGNIIELLHEFQDLLPTKFSEMKGIVRDLREMKITLNPDANPIKQ